MSDYTKLTDFAAKDALASGNPLKIVKGTEIDDEFEAIAAAIATKMDSGLGNWTIEASGTSLLFKYAGVTVITLSSSGSITVA